MSGDKTASTYSNDQSDMTCICIPQGSKLLTLTCEQNFRHDDDKETWKVIDVNN